MMNNDSKLTAKATQKISKAKKLNIFLCLGQSSDLNLIEHVFYLLMEYFVNSLELKLKVYTSITYTVEQSICCQGFKS